MSLLKPKDSVAYGRVFFTVLSTDRQTVIWTSQCKKISTDKLEKKESEEKNEKKTTYMYLFLLSACDEHTNEYFIVVLFLLITLLSVEGMNIRGIIFLTRRISIDFWIYLTK
jgi:hypothetical protein